jgi:hypothetical protein
VAAQDDGRAGGGRADQAVRTVLSNKRMKLTRSSPSRAHGRGGPGSARAGRAGARRPSQLIRSVGRTVAEEP